MNQIIIDCRIAMYKEDAIRLLVAVDPQNDTVIVSDALAYAPPKQPYKGKTPDQIKQIKKLEANTIIVVDNQDAFRNWDLVFDDKQHLDSAVRAYHMLKANNSLSLKDEVQRMYSPETVIQVRKMDLSGNQYELDSESVTNGHVAVLVSCWAAIKIRNTASLSIESEPQVSDEDDFCTPFCI